MDLDTYFRCIVLLMPLVLCHHMTVGLDVSSYETASFSINPSSEFTHFVTHNETGIVYVGGSDALYQLDANLIREEQANTAVQCEGNIQMCPNYNKILLIDQTSSRLITCGSEKQGTCQTRDLSNINNVLHENVEFQVAASGKLASEAIIAPGPDGTDLMYVSASYDEDRNPPIPLLSRRSLQNDDLFSTGRAGQVLLSESALTDFVFMLDYVSVFNWNSFTYFCTSQTLDSNSHFGDRERYVTKVSRICHDAVEFDRSYAEILLECRSDDIHYNLIRAAYVGPAGADLASSLGLNAGDDVFYGVFAKNEGESLSSPIPSSQSALCVFKLQDIEEAFIDVIHGCLAQGDKYQIQYIPGSSCGTFSTTREFAILQQCEGSNWQIASGTELLSTAAIEWTDTIPSSIITTTHRHYTVAFIGMKDGEFVKIHIANATSAREYERISLGGGPVLRDAEVDNNKEMVTVLTKQQLVKLRVSNCRAYTTCDECVGTNGGQDGDPYCGWCTLERRCSRYNECPMPDISTRWLPYNNAQCVSISNVTPYDRYPITITQQQVTLTIEQLPDLHSGESYQCIFDDIPAVPATKDGSILTCATPTSSEIPRIPMGSDYVTMQLYVYSTETQVKFVQRDFYFYECDTHKGCIACTNSSWACDWCIYSNKCTNDNSTCSMEDDIMSIINGKENPESAPRQGPGECPQLVIQEGEILIPVGVSRSITVTGMNLPNEDRPENYKCILDVEGDEMMTGADRDGDVFTCSATMYNYADEEQALDVSLSVVWTNDNEQRKLDDIYGFIVTMYKCSVDRPDCSRCLSNTTARPELNCGWCSQDDTCTVQGGSCSGGWMSAIGSQNCGAPDIMNVIPPSGTVNGSTVITITGTDLGRQFSDIESITVGDKDCDTDGLDGNYEVGSSVSCRTMSGTNNAIEPITVTVRGQQSTGNVVFTYRSPSISSIDPQEGPEAGGTIVTFTGQYLDACTEILATIGSECIMNRRTDVLNSTTARCRTTSSSFGSSHRLNVAFDGVFMKQSEDVFTYKPNPEVNYVQPRKTIQSGGITLTVTGNGFNLAQTPQVVMYVSDEDFTEDCENHNDTMMLCKTPNTKATSNSISRRRRQAGTLGEATFGFIIGDVSNLLTWSEDNNVTMEYFEDPVYSPFEEKPVELTGDILQIMGCNLDAGSLERDVMVYIGTEMAAEITLAENALTLKLPNKDPGRDCIIPRNTTSGTCVVVYHGYIPPIHIGDIRYPTEAPDLPLAVIIVIAVICVLLIGTLVIVMILYRRRVKGHEKNIGKLLVEMQDMETNIAADIHDAFVKLQTDVTDLTSDLDGTGMPFVPHRQYAISMFFTGLEDRPTTFDPEETDTGLDSATLALSKLLSDKTFLMALIQILDEDKSVPNKDRLSIASLLTVLMILEDKLPYLTDVMVTLLSGQVEDAIEDGKPTRLFQRTELIMEKLLSNWIALSLYDFLKDHAAYPLFVMYRAIKCQTEKGPMDMVTGKSYVSLNDENIISERLTFEEMKLDVIVNDEDGEKKEVAVLDTDSIGQVKSKILDAVYRNVPYSTRMQPWQVDLEWRTGRSGHLVLKDVDVSSDTEPGWKRVNTLKHFSVPNGSNVALANRQEVPNATVAGQAATRYSNIRDSTSLPNFTFGSDATSLEDGVQLWHLVKEDADCPQEGDRLNSRKSVIHNKKQIREVTFPRLLGTKGIVQEYMDRMFAAILNTGDVPIGVKYIFDIFDSLAARNNIEDETVLHKWKSNILPLRFWQKIITNPQYIFDISQSQCVEASLNVISQAFYDAFRFSNEQIGKDAPYRRLLYNREIPKYRDMVKAYYQSVNEMQRVSKATVDNDLKAICIKFAGLFSHVSTLMKLFGLIDKYKKKLMDELENDEIYEESGLAEKLEHVLSMMPDSARQEPRYAYRNDIIMEEDEENA